MLFRSEVWNRLAAATGDLTLKPQPLAGNLEDMPALDFEQIRTSLLANSPETRLADAELTRADLSVSRARAQRIPNVDVRGGARHNRELNEAEGFFDVGVRLPLFNRNQGGIDAARAEADRVRLERQRVELSLLTRLEAAYTDFTN